MPSKTPFRIGLEHNSIWCGYTRSTHLQVHSPIEFHISPPAMLSQPPVPSPSTIKLALVASAINRDGNVETGKMLFEKIRDSAVTVELPEKLIAFKAFMKRLKQKRRGKEVTIKTSFGELVERFESTFGIREYIIYNSPLSIYIKISDESSAQEIMRYFKAIQYFGSSDSICTCLGTSLSDPDWQKCIRQANAESEKIQNKGVIFY